MSNANLEGAILTKANFRGAVLAGAIMPDGSINEEVGFNLK
ncbi:pentapeptide repeat-containing protein [Microcoleus sp. herbarium8]